MVEALAAAAAALLAAIAAFGGRLFGCDPSGAVRGVDGLRSAATLRGVVVVWGDAAPTSTAAVGALPGAMNAALVYPVGLEVCLLLVEVSGASHPTSMQK